jgi:acyl carrier protein
LQAPALSEAEREQRGRTLMDALPSASRAALDVRWFEQIVRHPDGHLQVAQSRPVRAQVAAPAFAGSATEQAIHAVWSELLGMNQIGRNDNFFDLGGTSLTALQAVLKLEQKIGRQISPRRYVSETLAQLAAAYDATQTVSTKSEPSTPTTPHTTPSPGLMKRLVRLVQRA